MTVVKRVAAGRRWIRRTSADDPDRTATFLHSFRSKVEFSPNGIDWPFRRAIPVLAQCSGDRKGIRINASLQLNWLDADMRLVRCLLIKDQVRGWRRFSPRTASRLVKREIAFPEYEGMALQGASVEYKADAEGVRHLIALRQSVWRFDAAGFIHMRGYANAASLYPAENPLKRMRPFTAADLREIKKACGLV